MLVDEVGSRTVRTPIVVTPPKADQAAFEKSLARANSGGHRSTPARHVSEPRPEPNEAPPQPVVFGTHEEENGIVVNTVNNGGPWPFQQYRRTDFGYDSNEELHAQLASSPVLDPKPFGTRPGAAPDADRGLQQGQKIVVLDETRLDYLEQQRSVLNGIDRVAHNRNEVEDRDAQVTELSDLVFSEADYATMNQAVPDLDSVMSNISARAPDDPLFQRAVNDAKSRLKAKFESEGRTPDQLGKVIEAGEKGDFEKVRSLAKDQFVKAADALGPDARPEEIEAEFVKRAGIYTTYLTGDDRYTQAIGLGVADAQKEIFVDRPVRTVIDIAKAGGDDWANKSVGKLRELLTEKGYTPSQVIAIMQDPQIQKLMRQSLRGAETYESPETGGLRNVDGQDDYDLIKDISAIYSRVLYADGNIPSSTGEGKKLVDGMAQFIVDNSIEAFPSQTTSMVWGQAFQAAAAEGDVALALAVDAKAKGVEGSAFSGEIGFSPEYFVTLGVRQFREKYDELEEKIGKDSAFIQAPLKSIGGENLTPEKRLEIIDGLMAKFPEETKTLRDDLNQLDAINEKRQSVQFALDSYATNNIHFETTQEELNKIPVPPAEPGSDFPGAPPAIGGTNPYWFARSIRFSSEHLVKTFLPSVGGSGAFQRGSKGISAALFAANAHSLWGGPVEDMMFFPVHSAMATTHGTQALLGKDWSKRFFGENAAGKPNTPHTRLADGWEARINGSSMRPGIKNALVALGKGAVLDPLDIAYLGTDGYNSIAYFSGNTQSGEPDPVRGFAYAASFASDAALIVGAGLSSMGSGATLLRLGAGGWTGVGAALMVVAAGTNYFRGLYEHAHEFDKYNAEGWKLLGIENAQTAEALGKGATFADSDMLKNAGPFLAEMFQHAGYTPEQMVAFINENWTPEQADRIASQVKNTIDPQDDGSYTDKDYARIELYAENNDIKAPDYYNESNTPLINEPRRYGGR